VRERTRELVETQIELVERLAQAAESRDTETGAHVERMSRMCGRVARELGHTPAEAERLRLAAALHDIGKLAIPDRVLHKPGRLDADEWALMQSHTTAGADMLAGSRTPLVQLAEQIARSHHERWDGTGYPQGLAGEAIPLAARISALCDVFDALISRRAYKDAWPLDDAVEAILRERGRHFDPAVVDAFERLVPELRAQVAAPELPFVVAAADPDPRSSRHTARMRPTTPA
jgi:putative two-component system response regulator